MGTNWTEQQCAVIDNRGGTLLVSAAAGSGKTAVLVERVLRGGKDLVLAGRGLFRGYRRGGGGGSGGSCRIPHRAAGGKAKHHTQ